MARQDSVAENLCFSCILSIFGEWRWPSMVNLPVTAQRRCTVDATTKKDNDIETPTFWRQECNALLQW